MAFVHNRKTEVVTTNIEYRKHTACNALIFKESWAKTPTSLLDILLAVQAEFPDTDRAVLGFLDPSGAGIEEDELLIGPIETEKALDGSNSSSVYLTPAVSLAGAIRTARTDPYCDGEYRNVFFAWEKGRLVMIIKKS